MSCLLGKVSLCALSVCAYAPTSVKARAETTPTTRGTREAVPAHTHKRNERTRTMLEEIPASSNTPATSLSGAKTSSNSLRAVCSFTMRPCAPPMALRILCGRKAIAGAEASAIGGCCGVCDERERCTGAVVFEMR